MATADDIFRQGVASHQSGDLATAERCYGQLLDAVPSHIEAHFRLGNVYRRTGRIDQAIAAFEEVLRLAPNTPAALVNLGLAVSDAGNWPRAIECFARAATVAPELPDVLDLLGDALARCGRRDEALAALRESVARFPDSPRGHQNLGLHLAASGEMQEAIACFERSLALNPESAEAHNALGAALDAVGRPDEAQKEYREALRLRPGHPLALQNLGTSLGEQGQVADAIDSLRQALKANPDPAAGSALLVNLLYSASVTAEELRDEHIAWAERYANPLAPAEPPRKREPDAPGRIRVGYVFGELRARAEFALLELLLTHHDRTRFHVTAFANTTGKNEPLARLRRLADTWRPVAHLTDEQLAELIRADEIDILVDLCGHAPGNRLMAFARKPAATQVSLGYPATTGLAAMDYRVTDAVTDPPGAEPLYAEKLLRLSDPGWVYVPPTDAPPPGAPPSASEKPFTFGCLDHPGKLSGPCVEAWAAILKAVPESRLVLLAGESVVAAESLAARFGKLGVATDRLELMSRPADEPLLAYQSVDLALDPFPYGGAATTCDALWMGVPVLTVAGRDARGRRGVSILSTLGLSEFVADSPEQLVNLAATWAGKRESLAELRHALREKLARSPLTAVSHFVKHLEDAYRSA